MADFKTRYGSWALVTGASRGIGREFALELAERGLNIVLVARNRVLLEDVAQIITTTTDRATRVVVADFARTLEAVKLIENETADLDIGLCVANAGITQFSQFHLTETDKLVELLDVNVVSTAVLLNYFSKRLVARGKGGGLVPVSSQGAYVMLPNEANYAASKAYIVKLGEVMHVELKRFGIDVTTLLPGLTDTDMISGHEMGDDWEWDFAKTPFRKMSPQKAAQEALNALGKRVSISAGLENRLALAVINRLPQSWRFRLYERIFRKAVNPRYRWW